MAFIIHAFKSLLLSKPNSAIPQLGPHQATSFLLGFFAYPSEMWTPESAMLTH